MLVEKSNFTVTRMVRLLGVSRSGFYAWLIRVPSQRAIRAERIEAKVAWFHGDSDEVSGSPRILADLRGDGEVISRKTVAKTMRKLHLKGVCPKRWKTTTGAEWRRLTAERSTRRRPTSPHGTGSMNPRRPC
jgi:putative transposase